MSQNGGNDNTRDAPRHKIDAFVRLCDGNEREYVFRTRDLSSGGLFLYTKVTHIYPIRVGSTLDLELFDQSESIQCKVVVARVVEPDSPESETYPTGFGVRISEVDERNRERLEDLLSRLSRGQEPY